MVDCEHFFDGYKANPDYALACARTAYEAGARWVVLCDTNGGTLPTEVEAHRRGGYRRGHPGQASRHPYAQRYRPGGRQFACRRRAGVRQIQGTLNGIGERCGNANLVSIIPTLLLKPDFAERFETGVTPEKLAGISRLSRGFDELLNRAPEPPGALCRRSRAFATKAGIHASAIVKEPETYEHVPPESVGNQRRSWFRTRAGGRISLPS